MRASKNAWRLLIPLSLLISCKPGIENITVMVTPLRASSIYNEDAVFQYISNHADTNKTLAEDYYNKGLKIQKTDTSKAIYNFKRSLTIYPDYKKYCELGSLLYKTGCYGEMNELYRFLVLPRSLDSTSNLYGKYLFSAPTLDLVCDYVISNIQAYNNVWNNKSEEMALTKGLGINPDTIKKRVLADVRVRLSAPTEENKNALWDLLTSDEKEAYYNNQSTSRDYRNMLKDTSNVFEFDRNLVQQFNYTGYGSPPDKDFDWKEYENQEQKYDGLCLEHKMRRGNKDLFRSGYRTNFEKDIPFHDSIRIFIYAVDTSELGSPKDMRNIYYRLETFYFSKVQNLDNFKYRYERDRARYNPKTIASMIVAQQNGEDLSTFKFNGDKFTITYFKRTWEKPYTKRNFDNHISKIEQTGEKSYKINPDGTFKEISASAWNKATP